MTATSTRARAKPWTVLKDVSPHRAPTDSDILGRVLAPDRQAARQTAERLFPGQAVIVVAAHAWPCREGCP